MANYHTQFSESIDGITSEEREWIEDQLDADLWDPDRPPEWDAPLDEEGLGFEWEFCEKEGRTDLCIYTDESGDPEQAGDFVKAFLAKFRPDDCFGLTFAESCSRPRIGAFAGGLFVTREGFEAFSADTWVEGRIEQFKERPKVAAGDAEAVNGPAPGLDSALASEGGTHAKRGGNEQEGRLTPPKTDPRVHVTNDVAPPAPLEGPDERDDAVK